MTRGIPLIRCGSIIPFVRWMQANGRPVEDHLRAVHLVHVLRGDPTLPIPLTQALAFLRNASEAEGPDLPVRVVSEESVAELGLIGRIAFSLAGAAAVRLAGVLQRLFRESRCLIHQVSANPKSFDEVGRCRIGMITPEEAYI
jgi:hypothetical protein